MLSTPNVDRVRTRFLERTATGSSNSTGDVNLMRNVKRNDKHVYDSKEIKDTGEFVEILDIYNYSDAPSLYLEYEHFRDVWNGSSYHMRLFRGDCQSYFKRLEFHAGLSRLGMTVNILAKVTIPPNVLGTLLTTQTHGERLIDPSFIDIVFRRKRQMTFEVKTPIFMPSKSIEIGLQEDEPFPWPVIDMAEFEKSQADQSWHRKTLIIVGIKAENFWLLSPENDEQTEHRPAAYITTFLREEMFRMLELDVLKIVIPRDSKGGEVRDCVFIVFETERDAEIARNAVDEMQLPLTNSELLMEYSRIRARLFHHYNRETTVQSQVVESTNSSGKYPKSRNRRKRRNKKSEDSSVPDDGDSDIKKEIPAAAGGTASASESDGDDRKMKEAEVKSKASRSLPDTEQQMKKDIIRLQQRLAVKEAQAKENDVILEEIRYKLSATELVNEKLRSSARGRQDELMEQVNGLQRQLRDSAANEREMAERYNALLARGDEERERQERQLRDAVNNADSDKLIISLMRKDVAEWIDIAENGNEAGDRGNSLLARYEQDLKMVLAKIDIAREDVRKRELDYTAASNANSSLCSICLENPKTHLLLPCRHLVFCKSCFDRASENAAAYDPYTNPHGEGMNPVSCPVCRSPVRDHMHVYN